jgi:large subunit ribosomal protein L22
MRRFHARAKGRGVRILKRTSHITVTVSDVKAKGKNKGSTS